jgi:hypothetical protein
VQSRSVVEPRGEGAVDRPDRRGVEVADHHAAALGHVAEIRVQRADLVAPAGQGAPLGKAVGRLDVDVHEFDAIGKTGPLAGSQLDELGVSVTQGEAFDVPRVAKCDPHSIALRGGFELAVGKHLGDDAGLVRRKLLNGDHVDVERFDLPAQGLAIRTAPPEVHRQHSQMAAPLVQG